LRNDPYAGCPGDLDHEASKADLEMSATVARPGRREPRATKIAAKIGGRLEEPAHGRAPARGLQGGPL